VLTLDNQDGVSDQEIGRDNNDHSPDQVLYYRFPLVPGSNLSCHVQGKIHSEVTKSDGAKETEIARSSEGVPPWRPCNGPTGELAKVCCGLVPRGQPYQTGDEDEGNRSQNEAYHQVHHVLYHFLSLE